MASQLSAIELLQLGDEGRELPFLNKYWPYILAVPFGIGSGVVVNLGTRRPLFSGIQKHIVALGVWTVALKYIHEKRMEYYAEKDAVFRHYIALHPDDFPTPERKKWADVLEEWSPIR